MRIATAAAPSATLASAQWHNSSVLGGDIAAEVAKLKEQPGNELQVPGSGELAQATTTRSGVIIASYEPAGPVRPGSYVLPEQP